MDIPAAPAPQPPPMHVVEEHGGEMEGGRAGGNTTAAKLLYKAIQENDLETIKRLVEGKVGDSYKEESAEYWAGKRIVGRVRKCPEEREENDSICGRLFGHCRLPPSRSLSFLPHLLFSCFPLPSWFLSSFSFFLPPSFLFSPSFAHGMT